MAPSTLWLAFMPQKNASPTYVGPNYFSYKGDGLSLLCKKKVNAGK